MLTYCMEDSSDVQLPYSLSTFSNLTHGVVRRCRLNPKVLHNLCIEIPTEGPQDTLLANRARAFEKRQIPKSDTVTPLAQT